MIATTEPVKLARTWDRAVSMVDGWALRFAQGAQELDDQVSGQR